MGARDTGSGLLLNEQGALALVLGGEAFATEVPLVAFQWYLIAGTYASTAGRALLLQRPIPEYPIRAESAVTELTSAAAPGWVPGDILIGAGALAAAPDRSEVTDHFNGKISDPQIYAEELNVPAIEAAAAGSARDEAHLVARWDFGADPASGHIHDSGPHGLNGETVNAPLRAVTSWNFTGREVNFADNPSEYGAIFFHEDDLDDAGWEPAFQFTVPPDLPSAVYAARVTSEATGATDYIPFFVTRPVAEPAARIALLAPTYSYMAYGNEHYTFSNPASPVEHDVRAYLQPADHFALEQRLLSLYDFHPDGLGNAQASRLRPLVNMRPGYVMPLILGPHQLNADLYMVDWMHEKRFQFDVITDEDVHRHGQPRLADYRVIVTGSHPEYWTWQMIEALQGYLADGGRVMYLGGNGMYWVVAVNPAQPHRIELRRGHSGTGPWRSAPGEEYCAATGERGGLWRNRGRPPQTLVGIGMTAAGYDRALPFRREPDSFDPRAGFIFDGIPDDALIGDSGLVMGGAAGLETDRLDFALGTPPHALLLASATGFSDSYQSVVEEVLHADSQQGGTVSPAVRADIVYYEGPKGGAVFSAGSITWSGSLSHNGYDNHVSRVTENVLRRFADPGWTPIG